MYLPRNDALPREEKEEESKAMSGLLEERENKNEQTAEQKIKQFVKSL